VLQDLSKSNPLAIEADVVVIGAGMAGLILATRLSQKGLKVVVLESGARYQQKQSHPLNEVVLRGQAYHGAEDGRFRCLGGTSTRWGGAMLPFLAEDMVGWGSAQHSALMQHLPEIEDLFGLPRDDYHASQVPILADFMPRLAKWPSFRSRNIAKLVRDKLEAADGPIVWLNATVIGFKLDAAGRLEKVTAREPNGSLLKVSAKMFALAAGAIESTRLLLLLDRQHDNRIFSPDDVLGRYLHDHLAATIADIFPKHSDELPDLAGYHFQGSSMRSLRYELAPAVRQRQQLPAAWLHIAVITEDDGGFAGLRQILRKMQRGAVPNFEEITQVASGAPWLARAFWWRFARKRLLPPATATLELHQVVEQQPNSGNRISLSSTRTDIYGSPLAVIDWRVHSADLRKFDQVSSRFLQNWNVSPLTRIAEASPRPKSAIDSELTRCGGIYHPGGSARIGADPRHGVVDGDLKAYRVPNLRVVSTAAFPRGGSSNPTLMLMLFACRAADQIGAELNRVVASLEVIERHGREPRKAAVVRSRD
jgi:choline dehydrogenase-like flavoprotein